MNTVKKNFRAKHILSILVTLGMLVMVGCNKNANVDDVLLLSANEDAAETVASAVGEEDGGLVDQFGDLMELSTNDGYSALGKSAGLFEFSRTYDAVEGKWTIELSRERDPIGPRYAFVERTYTLQFLSEAGAPQKFWETNGDTARTVNFDIISGAGRHTTLRLSQRLTGLSGSFIATDVHTDLITVNGTYFRSAVDTITTRNAVRTSDHSLDLTVSDLKGPRGSRRNLSEKVSGTITGSYHAFITFTKGDSYRETDITRNINIVIGGGESDINVGGDQYSGDVENGELK